MAILYFSQFLRFKLIPTVIFIVIELKTVWVSGPQITPSILEQ